MEAPSALSDEQAAAAHYAARGRHLLILARPGSGKTYTLAERARFLLRHEVDPHRILAMTFSRRAALELRDRLPGGEIWAGTFHAICADILEKHGAVAGVRWPFRIVDEARARELLTRAVDDLGVPLGLERRARDGFLTEAARRIERRKRLGLAGHGDAPENQLPAELVERIDEYYCQLLRDANALDYSDLIARAVEAIAGDEATAEALRNRVAYLLVDEFHDISPEQHRLMLPPRPGAGGASGSGGWRSRPGHLRLARGRCRAHAPAVSRRVPAAGIPPDDEFSLAGGNRRRGRCAAGRRESDPAESSGACRRSPAGVVCATGRSARGRGGRPAHSARGRLPRRRRLRRFRGALPDARRRRHDRGRAAAGGDPGLARAEPALFRRSRRAGVVAPAGVGRRAARGGVRASAELAPRDRR